MMPIDIRADQEIMGGDADDTTSPDVARYAVQAVFDMGDRDDTGIIHLEEIGNSFQGKPRCRAGAVQVFDGRYMANICDPLHVGQAGAGKSRGADQFPDSVHRSDRVQTTAFATAVSRAVRFDHAIQPDGQCRHPVCCQISFLPLGAQASRSATGNDDGRNCLGLDIDMSPLTGLAIMIAGPGCPISGDGLRDPLDLRP